MRNFRHESVTTLNKITRHDEIVVMNLEEKKIQKFPITDNNLIHQGQAPLNMLTTKIIILFPIFL